MGTSEMRRCGGEMPWDGPSAGFDAPGVKYT